jgi:hypothetical protein
MQHAFHSFSLNTYGLAGNLFILGGFAAVLILLVTLVLQRSSVSH